MISAILLAVLADSITVDGKTTEKVYVTETKTLFIVADPETGKTWNADKSATVVKSEDREALRKAWIEKREPKKIEAPAPKPAPQKPAEEEKKPIKMQEHGTFIPDPEVTTRVEQNKYERFQAPTDRAAEAQAKRAAQTYDYRLSPSDAWVKQYQSNHPDQDPSVIKVRVTR